MTTNIVTPPDLIQDHQHTILLIDVAPEDVETLAYLCSTHLEAFNIYLYKAGMGEQAWFDTVTDLADTIIINTQPTSISDVKDQLIHAEKSYHYGPKRFLGNDRHHNSVLDYFVHRANEETPVTE
jgi:hypothetical protein